MNLCPLCMSELDLGLCAACGYDAARCASDLPAIGGRILERSNADFERACLVTLAAEQEKIAPDNALVALLCDAVRLSRAYRDATHLPKLAPALPAFASLDAAQVALGPCPGTAGGHTFTLDLDDTTHADAIPACCRTCTTRILLLA